MKIGFKKITRKLFGPKIPNDFGLKEIIQKIDPDCEKEGHVEAWDYFCNNYVMPACRFKPLQIGFKKVHPDAKLPTYAHEGDAGMDVYAVEDVKLLPFTPTLVKTGLVADIPTGYEIQVRPRSGLALKQGITVFNGTGTIDAGYRAEIGVILIWVPVCQIVMKSKKANMIQVRDGELEHKIIHKGDRIAQLVFAPVTKVSIEEIMHVSMTERGTNGFGSTGR